MKEDEALVLTIMAICIVILIISPFVIRRYKRMNPKPVKNKRRIDQNKVNEYILYGDCTPEQLKERKEERRHKETLDAIWYSSFNK